MHKSLETFPSSSAGSNGLRAVCTKARLMRIDCGRSALSWALRAVKACKLSHSWHRTRKQQRQAPVHTALSHTAAVSRQSSAEENRRRFAMSAWRSQKSSYAVKSTAGSKYSCYVTGTVSVMGRVVSDPVCNEKGKPAKPITATSSTSCNALLKAAGKCN